jgi:hypothetical protein
MPQQGSLELLNDPVAQALLGSVNPARLAYTWMDGSPRVVRCALWEGSAASSRAGSGDRGHGGPSFPDGDSRGGRLVAGAR